MQTATKIWHLLPHEPGAIQRLAAELKLSPVVAQLLLNRGVTDPVRAREFLTAPLTDLHPPELLPGITQAADRLHAAVHQQRRICVYGDYDVDGVTGTAILWQLLRMMGSQTDFYVPHRLEEGYGLNSEALRQIAQTGTAVVVTVDCGIASLAEAEEAHRLGLELIVTDHHEFKETLPSADVLVHPRLPGTGYPFAGLSGAGVAFKLAWALAQRASGGEKVQPRYREFLLDSVVLAALGLIADVVPLHAENRIFVRHGLKRLREAPSPGLKALLEAASLAERPQLTAEDVGYRLAPRLNAVGRLGHARLVVELLTTTSAQRAHDLARYIEEQNEKRQQLERRTLAEAREITKQADLDSAPALVLESEKWHAGVIGIVAGRLADLYARPVILIALPPGGDPAKAVGTDVGQGSGRSIPGFELHKALQACGEHLVSHGGHAAACGCKVLREKIGVFREQFCEYASRSFPDGPPAPRLIIDAEVPLSTLTPGLLQDIDRLQPYGQENRRPLFLAGGLQIVGTPATMGNGNRHLNFRVKQQGTTLRAVAFGMADRLNELTSANGQCCLVFTPQINDWQGFRRVELHVTDFQVGAQALLG